MKRAAARGSILALCGALVIAFAFDCVGLSRNGNDASREVPEYEIDQASEYWERAEPAVGAETRPTSVAVCLALVTARALDDAESSCEQAQIEDGGADVMIALETIRARQARARGEGSRPE